MSALLAALLVATAGSPQAQRCEPWEQLGRYASAFISGDGRVIDRTAADRTTSEGQAYALFFALVGNDRALFARLLEWTQQNLAQGSLTAHLPAWSWGKDRGGRWTVLDRNAASDADLWMAYALLEAGRLWATPAYAELGQRLLANIAAREVADLPGLGPMLLPGPAGFALPGDRGFRLNPSYQPPQLLRRFTAAQPAGPWKAVLASSLRMLREVAPAGAVADWVLYRPRQGFSADTVHGALGSYDAIRTYLWIGMLADDGPEARALADGLGGLLLIQDQKGSLPEKIDVRSLRAHGEAPAGFYAALLPLARARKDARAVEEFQRRLAAATHEGLLGSPPAYYDQNLALFGRGFTEGRFRFSADGALIPAWESRCAR